MGRTEQEIFEFIKQLNDEQCDELIKATTIIQAVADEQSAQLVDLRKSGLTIEQIADMWGVDLDGDGE